MSGKSPIVAVLVCAAALAQSVPALAGSVSDADLRGKKICWDNGYTNTFNKDGSFDGNHSGHGTWSLSGDTLTILGDQSSGASTITKDGDTFHRTRRGSKSGKDVESWGKYCS